MAAGEAGRQDAFRTSAIAAFLALDAGITLQELADANAQACADLLSTTPKGTLYSSVEAVAYHALTGELLRKSSAPGCDPVIPTEAQALIVRVKRAKRTAAVKYALRGSYSQQDAMTALTTMISDAHRGNRAPKPPEQDRSSAVGRPRTALDGSEVESLLCRAVALVEQGAGFSPLARRHVSTLARAIER